jgi:BirA family biotin operon repressor/biotin-[acetyl-CoA-carboxylase] ligase
MFKIIKLEEVDSTNDWIKRNKDKLSDLDGLIANVQTRGKGRGKNKWFSPPGGLWFSIMIKKFPSTKGALSQLSCVVIADALEKYKLNVELKWPNDIIIFSKKLGGILIERINESFIIGIGLNLNIELFTFPIDLREKVTTSFEVLKRKIPIEEISLEILKKMNKWIKDLNRVYIRYLGLNCDLGRKVKLISPKGEITGLVIRIEKDGGILISSEGKEKTFYSGSLVYL